MFVTVHTAEGWVVRDDTTGTVTAGPCASALNAQAEHESWVASATHAALCSCRPIIVDGQHVDTEVCGYCEWSPSDVPAEAL